MGQRNMAIFDIFRGKGWLGGKVAIRGLPAHERFSVSVAFFRVGSASAQPPYGGNPPPEKYADGESIKEAEEPEDKPLEFRVQRPVGYYYVAVGIIAYLKREGKMYAQVERFFPMAKPCRIERGREATVALEVTWPDLPLEALGSYGTVRPRGAATTDEPPKTVMFYDIDTKTMTEIPLAELAPGCIRVSIEGRGVAFVDASKLKHGAPNHNHDFTEVMPLLRSIHETLKDVYKLSWEDWLAGFQADRNPESEIAIWKHIADTFTRLTADKPLSPDARRDYFQVILAAVNNGLPAALETIQLREISPAEAQGIIAEMGRNKG